MSQKICTQDTHCTKTLHKLYRKPRPINNIYWLHNDPLLTRRFVLQWCRETLSDSDLGQQCIKCSCSAVQRDSIFRENLIPGNYRSADSEGLRGTPRDSEGLQGTPRDSKGLRGTPRDSKGLRGTPRDSERLQGFRLQRPNSIFRENLIPGKDRSAECDSEGLQGTPRDSEGLRGTPTSTRTAETRWTSRARTS